MQLYDIKYHLINIISVIIFSFSVATTISQFFRFSIAPIYTNTITKSKSYSERISVKNYEDYETILEKPFFKMADVSINTPDGEVSEVVVAEDLKDLKLLGTVSGSSSISRALIRKKREKESEIFKLWSDVYGYQLVRIDYTKIYLKKSNDVHILDMFEMKKIEGIKGKKSSRSSGVGKKINKNISRSELQQKVLNNIDNAMKGLRAGPYRVNGKIEGYKLFRVRPSNILYKLGARSGDIVKRVNGHPIDSIDKLYKMWQNLQGESNVIVDIERGGSLKTFDFNITE